MATLNHFYLDVSYHLVAINFANISNYSSIRKKIVFFNPILFLIVSQNQRTTWNNLMEKSKNSTDWTLPYKMINFGSFSTYLPSRADKNIYQRKWNNITWCVDTTLITSLTKLFRWLNCSIINRSGQNEIFFILLL